MTKLEIAKAIESVGDKIMRGLATIADGDALYQAAFALRTPEENASEYAKLLGEKGGLVKTKKKAASSRENGKLGGRPSKLIRVVNSAAHVHQLREPVEFRTKAELVRWLSAQFTDHVWTTSWSKMKLDSEMRDVELMIE